VFQKFESAINELQAYGGLPSFEQAEDLWQDLWHMEVHHSTAIEGNTLALIEVETLLRQGRTVGAKELKEYMEVLGYAEASRWVFDQASPRLVHDDALCLTELRQLHQMTMEHVWNVAPHPLALSSEAPGGFRQHEIAVFPQGMKPPTFPLVPPLVDGWIADVNQFAEDIRSDGLQLVDAPVRLAELHVAYERIHPFLDGNGRTGRLALNLILIRLGWPPVVILKTQRQRYLNALMKADAQDFDPLASLIAQASIDSLHRLIPLLAQDYDLVPLMTLADDKLSLAALRQAVARGRLEAVMDSNGVWRSSRQAIDAYWTSRQRKR